MPRAPQRSILGHRTRTAQTMTNHNKAVKQAKTSKLQSIFIIIRVVRDRFALVDLLVPAQIGDD